MEYAEYDTEVRFSYQSYQSSYNDPDSPRRSHEDPLNSGDEGADSDPGILGTLTSIFVGGVTDLLTDFSPQSITPAPDRYTSATKTSSSSTIKVTSSRVSASAPSTAPRRGLRSPYPEASANVSFGESGWRDSGMAAKHGLATAESSDGIHGHRAAGRTAAESARGGMRGDENSSWMPPADQRSHPMLIPATATGRASGTGDVAPTNSLVGSPTGGVNAGGLLGAMFSGITSLGQRATDLLTQLDHDFETIFSGVLEGSNDDGTELTGLDSVSEQRVGAGDQGRQRGTSSGVEGSVATDGALSGGSNASGKTSSGSGGGSGRGTAGGAGAALPVLGGARPTGGRTANPAAAPSMAKSPTAVATVSVRASPGGMGAAPANDGRVGGGVRGRNRQLDKSRSSSGGGDGWSAQGDDDNWGWGSSDNETGRATMHGAPSTASHGSGRMAAVPSHPSIKGRAQPKAAGGLQRQANPGAGTTMNTMVMAAAATAAGVAPPSPAARNGRIVSSSATGFSAISGASNLRGSRSQGGKVFIIKSAAGSASMRQAEPATASQSGGGSATAAGAGSASAGGFHNAPCPSKAVARADDPRTGAAAETSWPKKPVPVRSSTSTASSGSQPRTLGSGKSRTLSKEPTEAGSQPCPQLRPTQTKKADTAAAVAEGEATAAASAPPSPPVPAFAPVVDGAMFLAEAKAALRTMAESAESSQRELRQQLDEALRLADAAEARCADLQQKLEAALAETTRLGALAESLGEQLEFSQRRSEELAMENAHLATAATTGHHQQQHQHPHRAILTTDAACSPVAAASPAKGSPSAGWASAVGMAGGAQHGSGGHSRRLSYGGCGGVGSNGGSDELVEATLVAQLTAALADKARLARENDALARQLEGLKELLSYTAQQVSYDYGDGYGFGDEEYYMQHSLETASCGTPNAVPWSYRDALASVQLPPPCEATAAAAAAAAADAMGITPSSASLNAAAEPPSDSEERFGVSKNPLYDLTYGVPFSQAGGPARAVGPRGIPSGNAGAEGGDDVTRSPNAGYVTEVSKSLSGRVGMTDLEYDTPVSLADLYGTASSLAATNAASSGASHMSSELCAVYMPTQRVEPSLRAQSQQPQIKLSLQQEPSQDGVHVLEMRPHQHEVSLKHQALSLLMPHEGQLQELSLSLPLPSPSPVRTSSYPDGWEVLDEDGEVVMPQASGRSIAASEMMAAAPQPLPLPPSTTSWGSGPALPSTVYGKVVTGVVTNAADALMAAAAASPVLIAAASLGAGGGGGAVTRIALAAATSLPMKERTNLPGPGPGPVLA